MDNQRNLILAIVLSALVLFGWTLVSDRLLPTANPPATKIVEGRQVALPKPEAMPDSPAAIRDRKLVLGESRRVAIRNPRLGGSINLTGARIDDLTLTTYGETIAKGSPPVRLLSPGGTQDAYFAGFGWSGAGVAVPGADTLWQADGTLLAPARPVTLSWANGRGQTSASASRSTTATCSPSRSRSRTGAPPAVAVRPYGLVNRVGASKDVSTWQAHTGPIGAFDGKANYDIDFANLDGKEAGVFSRTFGTTAQAGENYFQGRGGWVGFGDKYWLVATIPDQATPVRAGFRAAGPGRYQADFAGKALSVQPGRAITTTAHVFAGAKEVALLDRYEDKLGIAGFDRAIDWGWFVWFEKPIFYLLDWLFRMIGNFGVAILGLTIIVRGLMFPVAQKQFKSMASMRVVQPKMKALQKSTRTTSRVSSRR